MIVKIKYFNILNLRLSTINYQLNKVVIGVEKRFQYKAYDSDNKSRAGFIRAYTRVEAVDKLKEMDLTPLELKEEKKNLSIKGVLNKLDSIELSPPVVGLKDKYVFCRQFASMLKSGIPIIESLKSLSSQIEDENLKEAVEGITLEIEKGRSLSMSLKGYPNVFSEYFIKLVEVGEAGGFLDKTLLNLAKYFKNKNQKKKELISNISYPAITASASALVLLLLMTTVLPNFARTFARMGIELPLPTRIILGLSSFLATYWWALGIGLILMVVGFIKYYKTEKGRYNVDGLLLKIPILNSFILENSLIIFATNLSLLEKSGVPFLQSMEIVNQNIGNRFIRARLEEARLKIQDGLNITAALKGKKLFPDIALQMIQTGEDTGELDARLEDIVDFYQEEVEEKFERMMALMEPILIVFLTGVIGGIVASIILPIFRMSQGV